MRLPITMPGLSGRVSRRDIALSPAVWFVVWGTFALFAGAVGLMALLDIDGVDSTRLMLLSGGLAVAAAVMSQMAPPEPDAARTHALLALTYLGPMLAMIAFAPQGSAVAITAAFAGPLTAVWIVDRRQIALHLSAATLALFLPSILGLVDHATFISCLYLTPIMWALAATCVIVLEAAEEQGAELVHLGRRDPLTGAGNRRLLDEELAAQLTRHDETGAPLVLLTFDLNGFKALNDTVGHAAGDRLLQATAEVLMRTARPGDTVVRQGGDEFCILLPQTTPQDALVLAELIRARLQAVQAFGSGISTGIGIAACPQDGTNADRLLTVADERLLVDKESTRRQSARRNDIPETARRAGAAADALSDSAPSWTIEGVSRRHLEALPGTWRLARWSGALYGALAGGILLWAPELARDGLAWIIAVNVLGLIALLVSAPPRIGSLRNHLYVTMPYLMPATYAVGLRPGAIALAISMFVGPLTAVRLVDRRQIVAHLAAATVVFAGLLALRADELPTVISLIIVISNLWVLGFCCIVVLESSERQGQDLARLVRRDPLTGLGNRRRLRERLAAELATHGAAGKPLTIVTLDLNGFKRLNDTAGHAAGDVVLRRVADALKVIAAPPAEAMRQGGDEFAIVLPDTTANEARTVITAISRSLGTIVEEGVPVSTGVGHASFPEDGDAVDTLLDRADHRLRTHKYGAMPPSAAVHGQPLDTLAAEIRAERIADADESHA
jgi:diguanylate cyclase (GGDEF)-like protein